jgi:hypothetical protein
MGWPIRRRRAFAFGLNKQVMAWTGPQNYAADFIEFFHTTMELDAAIFEIASNEQLYDEQRRMAKNRSISLPEIGEFLPTAVAKERLLPPGQLLRWQAHDQLRPGGLAGDPWYADLEQTPGTGASTPGRILPSQLTHGTVWSWRPGFAMHPLELHQAHGFNIFDSTSGKFSSQLRPLLEGLSSSKIKILMGGGWHIAALASWVMYCLANTVMVDRRLRIEPEHALSRSCARSSADAEEDLDEEDSRRDHDGGGAGSGDDSDLIASLEEDLTDFPADPADTDAVDCSSGGSAQPM